MTKSANATKQLLITKFAILGIHALYTVNINKTSIRKRLTQLGKQYSELYVCNKCRMVSM